MGPGDDGTTAGWRRARRDHDHAGDRDRLVVEPGRAVQHAVSVAAEKRHRLLPYESTGWTGDLLFGRLIERRLRHRACASHCKTGDAGQEYRRRGDAVAQALPGV